MSPTEKKGIKIAAQNRKAFHDYFVEDRYEAGIELCGHGGQVHPGRNAESEGLLLYGKGWGAVRPRDAHLPL